MVSLNFIVLKCTCIALRTIYVFFLSRRSLFIGIFTRKIKYLPKFQQCESQKKSAVYLWKQPENQIFLLLQWNYIIKNNSLCKILCLWSFISNTQIDLVHGVVCYLHNQLTFGLPAKLRQNLFISNFVVYMLTCIIKSKAITDSSFR